MILAKEAIEKAANWWAERILEDRPHSNGDNSFTSVTACLLADMGRQNITPDQADMFKKALAKRMAEYAESGMFNHFSIIMARAGCWPMQPMKRESVPQTSRLRQRCFLRKKMALWYAMAMAHQLSSCGGNDMDEKKNVSAEIEKVTITMSRPVAEAVAKACEMYLRLHMGQFEDLTDELCMARFYAALENDSFTDEEERDEIFHISIDRRNIMQEEMDKLYRRYVLSAPLDYCRRIPYRAEQVWLAIRHALAWHDNPKGDCTVQYDKPLNRSDQPQPMVQLYEAPIKEKPTCDGKCAKRGRC